MHLFTQKQVVAAQKDYNAKKEAINAIIRDYSVVRIVESLLAANVEIAELKKQAKKINVTEDQIQKHFNVKK